jgi:hypothetical protein
MCLRNSCAEGEVHLQTLSRAVQAHCLQMICISSTHYYYVMQFEFQQTSWWATATLDAAAAPAAATVAATVAATAAAGTSLPDMGASWRYLQLRYVQPLLQRHLEAF